MCLVRKKPQNKIKQNPPHSLFKKKAYHYTTPKLTNCQN